MKKKRIFTLLISLALLAGLLTACGPSTTAPTGQPTTTSTGSTSPDTPPSAGIQYPDVSAPEEGARIADHVELVMTHGGMASINPHLGASSGPAWTTYILIYDRLVYRVEGGTQFAPQLAKSWDTDDYQTFVFELRDDVNFHNGDHFTADDVVKNIEYSWDNPGGEAYLIWGKVASVRALGQYTVELVTNNVEVDFLFEIANPQGGMISPRALAENPETGSWIGTGPWIVTSHVTDVLLERNENYWGDIPPTKTLAFRDVMESSARRMMMQNGECHFSFGINPEDVIFFENDPRFTIYPSRSHMIFSVWFNMEHPITSDRNFRLAVAHALGLDEIAIVSGDRSADTATDGAIWGRGTQFRNNNLPLRERDIGLAKEYLAASSYNGEEIALTAFIMDTIRGSEVIQQQLAEIGINIRINVVDMPGFVAMSQPHNNQLEMAFALNNPSTYASSMRQFFYPGSGRNGTMYNNPRVTELVDQAAAEFDSNVRQALYYEIQELMYEDVVQIPVFWLVHEYVADSRLGGFYITDETSMHNFRNVFLLLDN